MARRCTSTRTGRVATERGTFTARSASGCTGAAIPRHRAERVERGARAESWVPIPTHQPNDPLAVDQGVVAVVSRVASFVLLSVVFGLSCHDTDAQNTAWLLHCVVARCVLDLLWDQKVPGSNPGAPTSQLVTAQPQTSPEPRARFPFRPGCRLDWSRKGGRVHHWQARRMSPPIMTAPRHPTSCTG